MAELNIPVEDDVEGQEAHVEAMVAKAEGREVPPAEETPERPAWLPEKFASVEDMAKAYSELEKRQGAGEATEEEAAELPGEVEAEEAVASAGLDMDTLAAKLQQNGELDAEDYDALSEAGIPKAMVDAYIDGQRAIGEKMVGRLHESVGGEETYNNIITWAADNLDQAAIDAFNDTIDGGSEAAVQLALQGLYSQYRAAGAAAPKLLGGSKAVSTSDTFSSRAQVTEAMRDPRYAKDPAYRAEVEARLLRSSVF